MESSNNLERVGPFDGGLEVQKIMQSYDAATGTLTIGDNHYKISRVNENDEVVSVAGVELDKERINKICLVAKQLIGVIGEDNWGIGDSIRFGNDGKIYRKDSGGPEGSEGQWKERKVNREISEVGRMVNELSALVFTKVPKKKEKDEGQQDKSYMKGELEDRNNLKLVLPLTEEEKKDNPFSFGQYTPPPPHNPNDFSDDDF